MRVIKFEDSWHASSDAFPGCSGQARLRSDAIEQLMLAIEEQYNSGMKQTRTRFVRDVIITRTWAEDAKFVEPRLGTIGIPDKGLPAIIKAWKQQVADEFNEALPSGGRAAGESIIFFKSVELKGGVFSQEASFNATLDFWYNDQEPVWWQSFTNDHDLIQHIFYDEGGVAGGFKLLSPTEEQTAREEGVCALCGDTDTAEDPCGCIICSLCGARTRHEDVKPVGGDDMGCQECWQRTAEHGGEE